MSLKQKTINGVKWTAVSTITTVFLQMIQIVILARFLSPNDFGLMAIIMVVIRFSAAFVDMGISNAIIHKQAVTHEQLSTLYWVNILAGLVVFTVVYTISPLIASFYNEDVLTELIVLVAITFLINPFGQQFTVLLEKDLKFELIAKVTIINKIISLIATTFFAYYGYGVYSLVYGFVISSIVSTLQYLVIGLTRIHKPSFIFRFFDIKVFLSFGLYQMGEKTINYFNSTFDTILIGKLLGTESLGVYSIAKELIMKPASIINPIITKVAFPVMSKIQDDRPKLKEVYLKTINYLSSVNFPIYLLLIILAEDFVLIMFGEKWIEAVPIVQILSIFGAIRSTANPIGSLLLARGRADLGFWWNLGLLFFTPIMIYIYSHWGLIGISWGLVANMLILLPLSYYALVKPLCGAGFVEYFWQIVKQILFVLLIYMVMHVINILLSDYKVLNIFVSIGMVVGLTYTLNCFFNKAFISELKVVFSVKN